MPEVVFLHVYTPLYKKGIKQNQNKPMENTESFSESESGLKPITRMGNFCCPDFFNPSLIVSSIKLKTSVCNVSKFRKDLNNTPWINGPLELWPSTILLIEKYLPFE